MASCTDEVEENVTALDDTVGQLDEKKNQALNSEFLYYSSVLKIIAPTLTSEADQEHVIPWIRRLFRPEYHTSALKEKRNKYLFYLTLTMFNDELIGVFGTDPPEGALRDLGTLPDYKVPAATWERDDTWREVLIDLPEEFKPLECSVHQDKDECRKDHKLDRVLDQEFQFFLYLARPYAALMINAEDRTKVACWLQTLCTIQGNCCSSMKAIRNDYMMALLGLPQDLYQVAKVSRILQILKKGNASLFKNKSLEEIDRDMEVIETEGADTKLEGPTVPRRQNDVGILKIKNVQATRRKWAEKQKRLMMLHFKN